MKKNYSSPVTEYVKLNSEIIAAPVLPVGGSQKADGSDAMGKQHTIVVVEEDDYEDEAAITELKGFTSQNLWENE